MAQFINSRRRHSRAFRRAGFALFGAGALLLATQSLASADDAFYAARFVFPLNAEHNHAPGVVECPNGDILVSWYRGSGERSADDVRVMGARLRAGDDEYGEAFLMADTPGFPDCNTCMMIDAEERLWLFWPLILDNSWDSCLTQYRVSSNYQQSGPPVWDWQGSIPLKPLHFEEKMLAGLEERLATAGALRARAEKYAAYVREKLEMKLSGRLGWQPRCKPTVLPSGRILLPLYTDTYSVSIMAISDDGGQSWYGSEPLVGYGNIQPAVLRREDGTLVAYMRENGPLNKIRVCESADDGVHWGAVGTIDLPNPGSGLDAVVLSSGRWLLVYNDSLDGRHSLAVSLSDDEGHTWNVTRHLENDESQETRSHYPAVIQGRNGHIHCVYSYFTPDGKTMKHATLNEAWIDAGD